MWLSRVRHRLRRALGRGGLPTFYHPRYRLPMASIEARTGIEPRRADLVLSYLLESRALRPSDIRQSERVRYVDLLRVHDNDMLDALHDSEDLARVFAVDASDVHVDEVLHTVRLACGATLEAAREALRRGGPTLNLLGGFHHAAPKRASALCALNDIAIAIATLRSEGFDGDVAVLDLDAHPPDGTAACLAHDERAWIGSISGSDWGKLDGVDETVLRTGATDGEYLVALSALLQRMPGLPQLAFVIAGGDVLASDRMGQLGMTVAGARRRDHVVAEALNGVATVWLPGGGYHRDAWRVLTGTALAILGTDAPIDPDDDPMHRGYARIARTLPAATLTGGNELSIDDLMVDLVGRGAARLLGYYTADGIEHALERYGVLGHLRRLGYRDFHIEIHTSERRDRIRLYARSRDERYLLAECVLEKRSIAGADVLYVHWLTLRDAARRSKQRPLPGQEHPGLGLARESAALMQQIATRLDLAGVAFTPAWYHMAYFSRDKAQFVSPERQGRFEAMLRDFADVPVREVSDACASGRVTMNGEPYTWESDDMIRWREPHPHPRDRVEHEMTRVHFALIAQAT